MQKINIDKPTSVFIIVAAILLVELLVVFPWEVSKVGALTKIAGKLIEKLNSIENEWPRKDQYLENKELLKEEIQKVRGKFIARDQESKALSFISASSKDFGIKINSLTPEDLKAYTKTKVGNFEYLPIKVKARGNFHNLAMFLDHLSSSQYFFEVKELTILSGLPYSSIEMVICGVVAVK